MEKFLTKEATTNPYEVRLSEELQGVDLTKQDQLAYVVNPDNFTITMSRSGHNKIVRGEEGVGLEGGWLFPLKGKITFYCGALGWVSDENKEIVQKAIEKKMQKNLRVAN